MDGGDGIDTRIHLGARHRGDEGLEAGNIGTHCSLQGDIQTADLQILIQPQRDFADMIAAHLVGGKTVIGALCDPFYRPPDAFCAIQHAQLFGIQEDLHPESTADIAGQDSHAGFVDMKYVIGQLPLDRMHALGRGVQAVATRFCIALILAQRSAGLHRIDDDAVVDQFQRDRMGGIFKPGLNSGFIAKIPGEGSIVRGLVINQGRIGGIGLVRVGHRWQVVVIHHDQFRCIAGLVQRFRNNEGDRIADMADFPRCQGIARWVDHFRSIGLGHDDIGWHRANAIGQHVVARKDIQNAWRVLRIIDIDGKNIGMGIGRAHGDRIGLIVPIYIGRILPVTGQ